MIKILDKEYPEVVERIGYTQLLKFFEGLLIENSSDMGYKLSRYFYENRKYQNETLIDEIIIFKNTKEEILKELERIIRKKFPTEEIFMEPDLFECFEEFHDFDEDGFDEEWEDAIGY